MADSRDDARQHVVRDLRWCCTSLPALGPRDREGIGYSIHFPWPRQTGPIGRVPGHEGVPDGRCDQQNRRAGRAVIEDSRAGTGQMANLRDRVGHRPLCDR